MPAGTARVEVHPGELGSEMPLAEALLAQQGSVSADPATSHAESQWTLHTGPKGCLSPQFSGEILSKVAEQSSVSLRASINASGQSTVHTAALPASCLGGSQDWLLEGASTPGGCRGI